ncbi:MAG: radical SAM protein [Gammaproteobacteria bacterium]|nr:radical SAM protein [Gammaproteobacteria bacterium]
MFNPFPVQYIEPVFRPPSEGRSLIFQVTNGCSWNRCTYCSMYTAPQKKFRPRAEDEVLEEIRRCGETGVQARRVFLADGDAMVLSMRRLRTILQAIQTHLPSVSRVSAYCLPGNLKNKTVDDLRELEALGLKLIYVGAESGDDTVLKYIDKGETYDSTASALLKAHEAGIKTSVMILNGMGGKKYSEQHALASARLVNETQPHYVATLVLTFYEGPEKVIEGFRGNFTELSTLELCEEIKTFIRATELKNSIFRSDHASNHLILKGVLGKDKPKMLQQIDQAIEYFKHHPEFDHGHFGY